MERVGPEAMCPYCEIVKTERTRHCVICNKCIERYDHHCPWINNCIGASNNNIFLWTLFTLTADFIMCFFVSVELLLIFYQKNIESDYQFLTFVFHIPMNPLQVLIVAQLIIMLFGLSLTLYFLDRN